LSTGNGKDFLTPNAFAFAHQNVCARNREETPLRVVFGGIRNDWKYMQKLELG
jgi:hypothetical protein